MDVTWGRSRGVQVLIPSRLSGKGGGATYPYDAKSLRTPPYDLIAKLSACLMVGPFTLIRGPHFWEIANPGGREYPLRSRGGTALASELERRGGRRRRRGRDGRFQGEKGGRGPGGNDRCS